jgi:hypothetical protein
VAPETHLLLSWIIAAKTTDNPRDCRLVTLAGILPDVDGLGLIVDFATEGLGLKQTHLYGEYHHYLLHGVLGGVLITAFLTCLARHRWQVALLASLVFHLHLLCDFVGSRGPSPADLWPIYYLGPFTQNPTWVWKGQLRLDGWFNRYFSAALFLWSLWLAVSLGHSVLGVFSRRADRVFVGVLSKWHEYLAKRIQRQA